MPLFSRVLRSAHARQCLRVFRESLLFSSKKCKTRDPHETLAGIVKTASEAPAQRLFSESCFPSFRHFEPWAPLGRPRPQKVTPRSHKASKMSQKSTKIAQKERQKTKKKALVSPKARSAKQKSQWS